VSSIATGLTPDRAPTRLCQVNERRGGAERGRRVAGRLGAESGRRRQGRVEFGQPGGGA
jgi:hypothetical protein